MEVVHIDEQVLVINKPPGLLAQPDRTGHPDVLSRGREVLAAEGEEDPFLGLVHRLDRPTSGLMILGRTSEAARVLSAQFRERIVDKRYLAIVEGKLRGIGSWTDYIAKPDRQPQLVSSEHPEGKRARLQWQALASSDESTLLQIELQTGRPHQIRLQAATRGHPVLGDARYGSETSLDWEGIILHHALLRVDHPATERRETYVAGPPAQWQDVATDEMWTALHRMLDRAQLS